MATEGANSDPTLFDEDTFKSLILAQPEIRGLGGKCMNDDRANSDDPERNSSIIARRELDYWVANQPVDVAERCLSIALDAGYADQVLRLAAAFAFWRCLEETTQDVFPAERFFDKVSANLKALLVPSQYNPVGEAPDRIKKEHLIIEHLLGAIVSLGKPVMEHVLRAIQGYEEEVGVAWLGGIHRACRYGKKYKAFATADLSRTLVNISVDILSHYDLPAAKKISAGLVGSVLPRCAAIADAAEPALQVLCHRMSRASGETDHGTRRACMAAIGDVVDGMGGRLEHGLLALVFNALTVIITEGLAEERLTVLSALEVATSVVEVSARGGGGLAIGALLAAPTNLLLSLLPLPWSPTAVLLHGTAPDDDLTAPVTGLMRALTWVSGSCTLAIIHLVASGDLSGEALVPALALLAVGVAEGAALQPGVLDEVLAGLANQLIDATANIFQDHRPAAMGALSAMLSGPLPPAPPSPEATQAVLHALGLGLHMANADQGGQPSDLWLACCRLTTATAHAHLIRLQPQPAAGPACVAAALLDELVAAALHTNDQRAAEALELWEFVLPRVQGAEDEGGLTTLATVGAAMAASPYITSQLHALLLGVPTAGVAEGGAAGQGSGGGAAAPSASPTPELARRLEVIFNVLAQLVRQGAASQQLEARLAVLLEGSEVENNDGFQRCALSRAMMRFTGNDRAFIKARLAALHLLVVARGQQHDAEANHLDHVILVYATQLVSDMCDKVLVCRLHGEEDDGGEGQQEPVLVSFIREVLYSTRDSFERLRKKPLMVGRLSKGVLHVRLALVLGGTEGQGDLLLYILHLLTTPGAKEARNTFRKASVTVGNEGPFIFEVLKEGDTWRGLDERGHELTSCLLQTFEASGQGGNLVADVRTGMLAASQPRPAPVGDGDDDDDEKEKEQQGEADECEGMDISA